MLAVGDGTCLMIASSNCVMFLASTGGSFVNVVEAHPSFAEA